MHAYVASLSIRVGCAWRLVPFALGALGALVAHGALGAIVARGAPGESCLCRLPGVDLTVETIMTFFSPP